MKNITRLLAILLVLFVFASSPVKAMSKEYNANFNDNLQRRNDLIVNAIKTGETDIEKLIRDNFTAEDLKAPEVEKIQTIRIEKINDTIITFKNDGTFYIDTIKEKYSPSLNSYSRSATQYKRASNSYEARGILGNLLWEAYIEAEFGYDGNKAWVNGSPYGYYRRGALSIWQVSNWYTGWTNYEGQLGARAYARGNFHYGIEYEGVGIIIQDLNLDLRVSCNYNGKIFKNTGI